MNAPALRALLPACLLWLLCLLPVAARAQGGVTLSMEFFYGDMKAADVTEALTFSADGREYELRNQATAVGLARLLYGDSTSRSRGVVDDTHGLLMTLYQEQRGKRDAQQAELKAGVLHLRRGEQTREEAMALPVFDHLSAVYRSYLKGEVVDGGFQYTNGWRLKEYEYANAGMETVSTGLGEVEAVLLVRESARGVRKIWLAPALDYLPVRLYVNDKGHEFTTVVKSVHR